MCFWRRCWCACSPACCPGWKSMLPSWSGVRRLFPPPRSESAFAMVSQQVGGFLSVPGDELHFAGGQYGHGHRLAAGRRTSAVWHGAGQCAPEESFFGVIEPRHRVPRNGIILVGAFWRWSAPPRWNISRTRWAAAPMRWAPRRSISAPSSPSWASMPRPLCIIGGAAESRTWSHLLVPVLGFVICGFIWLHLSRAAMILGAVWMSGRHSLWRDPHPRLPLRIW